ncbi:MAG: TolC family protein [Akkermansia sp.]|nr:TolC family protein [Akkermansia sp.]
MNNCSLEQRLDTVAANIHRQFEEADSWDKLPLRVISWEQAIAMVMRCNASVKDAQSMIEEAERESLSVYTEMIPGLSYYGYFTKSIEQLSNNVSANDLSSNINVTFSIPTLSQVPYRVYAAKARTYAAIKAKEGKERELIAQVYALVRNRELDLKLRDLSQTNPDLTEQDKLLANKNDITADAAHWQKMSELLGDYSARWQILPSSAPKISWGKYEPRMNKLDDLVVCMYALRLEQARLSQYQTALRYFPTINTSLYSPSLFSSSGGTYQGTFLSGEDTRLNLSLSYSLDTQLSNWNSYKRGKAQYEKSQREVAAGIIEHKNKLATLKASVREYNNWRSYMEKRIDYLRHQPAATAEELIARDRSIYDMKKELINQEKAAVESEAAMVLEYGLIR